MTISLGIHVGHDAAVAVVIDGRLIAAMSQERKTRTKHDGEFSLSDRLPLKECLDAAGAKIEDVTFITTSIQSAATGGIGLGYPLASPNFEYFDPLEGRHSAISHHLAHALSAFALCPAEEAAIIVHDRAGSSTRDGGDFYLPFSQWAADLTSDSCNGAVKSENVSIYNACEGQPLELKYRTFCIPHVRPAVYVDSVCALYDNVSRHVFGSSDAHGQLMALAALPSKKIVDLLAFRQDLLLDIRNGMPSLRNGWQAIIEARKSTESYVSLARATQRITEILLVKLVEHGVLLTGKQQVAAAGGAFLNVVANTACAQSRLVKSFFVPPAPHDAGIAVGCAYAPYYMLGLRRHTEGLLKRSPTRLGPHYSERDARVAVGKVQWALDLGNQLSPVLAASLLHSGEVIARCSGRSEFGPRALGGRSLLASPFANGIAKRLNRIKNRQTWRPVAPIVTSEQFDKFFDGPISPHMQFTSRLRAEHAEGLQEAVHLDGTARPQSLEKSEDAWLHALLVCFGEIAGAPMLLNTSLNIAGQPMVESFDDSIAAFLLAEDIDSLLLNDFRVVRKPSSCLAGLILTKLHMVPGVSISMRIDASAMKAVVSRGALSQIVPNCLAPILTSALTKEDVTQDWARLKAEDRARNATVVAALKLLGFVLDVEFAHHTSQSVHCPHDA